MDVERPAPPRRCVPCLVESQQKQLYSSKTATTSLEIIAVLGCLLTTLFAVRDALAPSIAAAAVGGAASLAAGLERYFHTVQPNAVRDSSSIVAGSAEVRQAVCLSQGLAFEMARFRYQR